MQRSLFYLCFLLAALSLCGCESEKVKSLFGKEDSVLIRVNLEGLSSELNAYQGDSAYSDWSNFEVKAAHANWRVYSNVSDAAPCLQLSAEDGRSSGSFELFFLGNTSGYLRDRASDAFPWSGKLLGNWHGGVLIPGTGKYTIEEDFLKLSYERNELSDLGMTEDIPATFPISATFELTDLGTFMFNTLDLGLSSKELGEWSKIYNQYITGASEAGCEYEIRFSTTETRDELCQLKDIPSTAQRVHYGFNLLKAVAKSDDKAVNRFDFENLYNDLNNMNSWCDRIRLEQLHLAFEIASHRTRIEPRERSIGLIFKDDLIPIINELNGVDAIDQLSWMRKGDLVMDANDICETIFRYGWSLMAQWQDYRWSTPDDAIEARNTCQYACTLAQEWGLDSTWYETNMATVTETISELSINSYSLSRHPLWSEKNRWLYD